MAIPFLNHLDVSGNINLNDNKLNDFVVDHSTTSAAGNVTGKLIYDSGTLKYYDGSAWQSLGTSSGTMSSWILEDGDGTEVTIEDAKEVKFIDGDGLQIDWTDTTTGSDGDPYDLTFSIDLTNGYSDVTPASGDKFLTIDSDGSTHQRTTVDALATLFAGSGLTATNGVIAVNTLNQNTTGSAATLTTSRNIAATGDIAWNVDFDGSGDVTAAATIQSGAVEGSMLNNNAISDRAALSTGLASTDELLVSDAGVLKKMDVSVIQTYMQNNLTFTSNTDVDVNVSNLTARLPQITESVTIGDATDVTVTTSGNLVVTGDLTVSGDTVSANVATLNVEDKNITLNQSSGDSSSTANGAGLTIQDAVNATTDATMLWDATNDEFDFSHPINVTGKVTATGTSVFASLDISGDVDVDGTLETDALTIAGTSLNEVINDRIGAVVTAGEGIDVTNDDGANTVTIAGEDSTASNKGIVIVAAGEGIDVSYSSGTATVAGEDASTSNKGIIEIADTGEAQAGTSDTVALTPAKLADTRVTATIDVSDSSFTSNLYAEVTHNLGSEDVIVQLFDSSTKETVYADVARTDKANSANNNKIKITFASAPANDIEVLITSIQGATAGSVAYS